MTPMAICESIIKACPTTDPTNIGRILDLADQLWKKLEFHKGKNNNDVIIVDVKISRYFFEDGRVNIRYDGGRWAAEQYSVEYIYGSDGNVYFVDIDKYGADSIKNFGAPA